MWETVYSKWSLCEEKLLKKKLIKRIKEQAEKWGKNKYALDAIGGEESHEQNFVGVFFYT